MSSLTSTSRYFLSIRLFSHKLKLNSSSLYKFRYQCEMMFIWWPTEMSNSVLIFWCPSCVFVVGLLVLDDEDEEDHDLDDHISVQHQQQQYQTPPSRGTNSSSMGRLNGRQMGHPSSTGMTTLVSSSSSSAGSTYPHRTGMMMAQHMPHYQLPPTPPHHPIHPHLSGYGVQHPHLVANNSFSTKDVMDNEMDNDPTTLLKQAPVSSKFIPAGNQTWSFSFFISVCLFRFVACPSAHFVLCPLLRRRPAFFTAQSLFCFVLPCIRTRIKQIYRIKRVPGNNFCPRFWHFASAGTVSTIFSVMFLFVVCFYVDSIHWSISLCRSAFCPARFIAVGSVELSFTFPFCFNGPVWFAKSVDVGIG